MDLGLISFDSGTALDRLRIVGNDPTAIGYSGFLPELAIAMSDTQTPLRRAFALGFTRGCLVGFGVEDALTLREAETVLYAEALSYENLWRRHERILDGPDERAQAVAQASGVLHGYKSSTAELVAAEECVGCERRVIRDLDPWGVCPDGLFCGNPDCWNSFPHQRDCREER